MKRIFSFIGLIFFFLSIQSQASGQRILCDHIFHKFDDLLNTKNFSSVAIGPVEHTPSGTIKVTIDYSTDVAGTRQIELPSFLQQIPPSENLYLAIVAGNSGDAYQNTYHSLAFQLADYLQKQSGRPVQTTQSRYLQAPLFQESLTVTFDDGSTMPWNAQFNTEKPSFRTASGEIFYYPRFFKNKSLLLVRPIGDYNEVGDFGVLVAQALQVPSKRIILINDSLQVLQGKVTTQFPTKPQAFDGNNALFSVIRNLSYPLVDQMVRLIQEERQRIPFLRQTITDSQIHEMKEEFLRRANIRYKGHLGQAEAFNLALKNFEPIYNFIPMRLGLDPKSLKQYRDQAYNKFYQNLPEEEKNQILDLRQQISGLGALIQDPYHSEADRKCFISQMKNLKREIATLDTDKFETEYSSSEKELRSLDEKIQSLIRSSLQFSRIQMGILPEEGWAGSNKDLVLGPISSSFPKKDVFQEVQAQLDQILDENFPKQNSTKK